jgi:P3 major capsid protein
MAKPAMAQRDPRADNMMARQAVLERTIDMWQPLPPITPVGDPRGQILNFQAKNVGLIKRFVVEVSFTLVQSAAETHTRTAFGPANIFSNITLTDLNNLQRINTTGWHLTFLATARRRQAMAAAFTNDSPVLMGSNFPVGVCPSPLTTIQTIRFFFEVPVSYSDIDLRGAIYAATTGANVNLQMTVNPTLVAVTGANPTLSVYQSTTAAVGTIASFTVTVYQNYLDQIPMYENRPILPLIDLSYAYMAINTVLIGLAVNQENSIAYANFRSYMSTTVVYDNFGSASTPGADVGYWAIQVANSTNVIKFGPYMSSFMTRSIIQDDYPAVAARSVYYFDHRTRPINTDQFGNQLLVLNPAQVQAATSQVLVGYEMLALQNQIVNSTSASKF